MTGQRRGVFKFTRQPQLFQKLAISFSVVGVVLLASFCSAGTVPNRGSTPVVGIGSIEGNTQGKTPARRVMHPAFANAGRNAGLEIWRIENFEPVAYPQRDHGKFYTGDSYIVLNTKKDRNNKLTWDVHFWLGSETSVDEAGAAAILTVQLDDILNGVPVQHREVQDHESSLFLSYFRNGVRYEKGGVGSGFTHVDTNAAGEKRLFQVKGKRNVRVRQVNLSVSSMNKGDCFILDAGNDIYVYVGSASKRVEKLKAISAANQIRDQDHNGRARVQIIDEYSTDVDKQQFFTILGSGSPSEVPEESVAEDDADFERNDERSVTLYKVTDATGTLKFDIIATKPIRQEMLDTNDCFILDTGSGIYVWVGKKATQQEKSQSVIKAQEFLQTKKYPAWTQVHRIVEGAESAPFKQYFATWRDAGMAHTRLVRAVNEDFGEDTVDEGYLQSLKKSGGRALGFMPDNGDGIIEEIIKIRDGEVKEVHYTELGALYGADSAIVRYLFPNENGEKGLVSYYWLGKDSSADDKNLAEEHANEIKSSAPISTPIIARITQGHEPRHFRKIFKGKLFTHFTGDEGVVSNSLYRIRGTAEDDVIAEKINFDLSLLSSDDVFIIKTLEKSYIWNGVGASDFEKSQAANVAQALFDDVEAIDEGAESEEFWQSVGGKPEYDTAVNAPGAPILDARLFHGKILSNGRFKFEEIQHFSQDDLDVDDIMLLDGGDEVYVWIGEGSTDEEKRNSFPMAKEYIRRDPTERTEDTVPLIKIFQGQEPGCFKRIFPNWNEDLWESIPSYDDVKKQVADANESLSDILKKINLNLQQSV